MMRDETLAVADIAEIFRLLPHRYPFLLVDRVIDMRGDEHGIGIKATRSTLREAETKDEAKRALGTELRSRKLAKPMTFEELNVFCEETQTARIQIPQRTACRHPEMGQGLAPGPFRTHTVQQKPTSI